MVVDKYVSSSNNTTNFYNISYSNDRFDRRNTRVAGNFFYIDTSQYGMGYDGWPKDYRYSKADGDSGAYFDTLTWGYNYLRNRTSSGYSAYSGWNPVSIIAPGQNIMHKNTFNYTYDGKYQGQIIAETMVKNS